MEKDKVKIQTKTMNFTDVEKALKDIELKFNDLNEQMSTGVTADGEMDHLVEFFEVYEKIKVSYISVFYRIPPDQKQLAEMQRQCDVMVQEMTQELQVSFMEQKKEMDAALAAQLMLPERYELEIDKAQETMQQQIKVYAQECMSKIQAEASKIENSIVSEKEYKLMLDNPDMAKFIVDQVQFYQTRVKQTCMAGDKVLYEIILPETIREYPIVPLHY